MTRPQTTDAERLDSESESAALNRRRFLAVAAAGTWIAGVVIALLGAARSVFPSVLPGPSKRFKIGLDTDFAPGLVKEFEEESVIVFSDDEGLYAISKVCTHLGCIVLESGKGFHCPCHGSLFAEDGQVLKGPAPRDLDWFAIERLPSGQLVVDRGKVVERGMKTKRA